AELTGAIGSTDPLGPVPASGSAPMSVRATAVEKIERLAAQLEAMASSFCPGSESPASKRGGRPIEPADLITQERAAGIACCSSKTIRRRIEQGILKKYSMGRVSRSEVEAKLDQIVRGG
ncbi:MAG: hypothetical protein ACF8LL_02925, partial [Phycisphaerales bacterium]